MLLSDLCDYNDAYVVVERKITVKKDNDDKTKNKNLIVDNAEDLIMSWIVC